MPENMTALKQHWSHLISRSRYRDDIDGLSEEIGKSPAYLRGLLRNTSVPGVDVSMALSVKLGCSMDELLSVGTIPELDAQQLGDAISKEISRMMTEKVWDTKQPTGEDIMRWWLRNSGRLDDCDMIKEQFDLFHVPDGDGDWIRPYQLGARSLASKELGANSIDLYHRTIGPLSPEFRRQILTAQYNSIETGPVTTIETLNAAHPDTGAMINIEYTRTFAPVFHKDGLRLILNYSKLLRKPTKIGSHVSDVDAAIDPANL